MERGSDSEDVQPVQLLRNLWRHLRDKAPFSEDVRRTLEQLPELFARLDRDNDRRNKREVYLQIAKFLGERTSQPTSACLAASHRLCGESDREILEDGEVLHGDSLVASARELIVAIKVHYESLDTRSYMRRIEIYFMKSGNPSLWKSEATLRWEYAPTDVRDERLRHGNKSVAFNLFPPKGN